MHKAFVSSVSRAVILQEIAPITQFKCRVDGWKKEHNILLHPPPGDSTPPSVNPSQLNQEGTRANIDSETSEVTGEGATVTAVTGAGKRICLIPHSHQRLNMFKTRLTKQPVGGRLTFT